jgi:ferredoxin-NADP reductase
MPPVRKLRATIRRVEHHDAGVYTVNMEPEKKAPRFRAGQFLHLALDAYDPSMPWPESRVFSIANAPTRREMLRVTFAVKGTFTQRMADEMFVGGTVWLKLPYGAFRLEVEADREVALVAGGTGITPYISFMEEACDNGCDAPIHLFYGVRTADLALYGDVIAECRKKLPRFRAHLFVETPKSDEAGYIQGQLNLESILESLQKPSTAIFYLSGPLAMIRAFRAGLTGRGIDPENISVDDWE